MVVADLVEKQISDWSFLHSPPRLLTRIQLPCTFPCRSAASELLCLGDERKHIGQTLHNDRSSRSHTAFRLSLEQGGVAGELNIVDLAGSERLSPHMRAGGASVQAARASEGAHINKSLLVLSTVIHKLSEPGRAQHIPYRSSKITRILQARLSTLSTAPLLPSPTIPPPTFSCPTSKFLPYSSHLCSSQHPPLLLPPPIAHEPSSQLPDALHLAPLAQNSLGGNAFSTLICCVNPAGVHAEETHHSLRFATRARRVRTHPVIQQALPLPALIKKYEAEIRELKLQVAVYQQARGEGAPLPSSPSEEAMPPPRHCRPRWLRRAICTPSPPLPR